MPFKAKTVSEVVKVIDVRAGSSRFGVEMRRLTPKHYAMLREQASEMVPDALSGAPTKVVNQQKFSDMIFDAAVLRAVDLTPAVAEELIELDADSEQPETDEHGHITSRAFLKFLWDEAPGVATQLLRANDQMLTMAKLEREIARGNSASSSAA